MDLSLVNKHWKEGFSYQYPLKRTLYEEIRVQLEKRFILSIVGLRRTGKTTLIKQLIENLISERQVPRSTILYYTFDEPADLPKIIDEYTIEQIVAGVPQGEKGELTPQAKKTLKFIEEIKKKVSVPIVLWDETLTTYEAESILIEADVSRKKRKEISDKLAAALILQSYLNHESNAS